MLLPGLTAIDKIISEAIINVYQDIQQKVDREVYARDLTKKIRSRYLSYLIESTKYITLIGHNNPIELKDVFIEPGILRDPHLSSMFNVRQSGDQLHDWYRESQSPIYPALSFLSGNQLIVGQPGSGKSTLAKYITLAGANYFDQHVKCIEGKIPFYFAVKDLSSSMPAIQSFDWRLALNKSQSVEPKQNYLAARF